VSNPFYIILGLAPGIIWLLFFLRKDVHPESNRMIVLIFLLGMVIAFPAAILECIPIGFDQEGGLKCFSHSFFSENFPYPLSLFLYIFLGIALIEETIKYLVVRFKALRDPEFDEPIDAMLYMIIAALGFATIENILVLFSPGEPLSFSEASIITTIRFIGATFLHALCSGLIGYFLARSFLKPKQKIKFLLMGFPSAILLHGLFNISIIKIGESLIFVNDRLIISDLKLFIFSLSALITILVSLALFVLLGFRRLKKLASICLPELKR